MSTLATAALTLLGIALLAFALRDVFETLLHPEGRGPLARVIMRAVWTGCRRPRGDHTALQLAGPLGLVLVVGTWAALLVLGWALLLWPHLEDGFSLQGPGRTGFWDALHVSLSTLTTLGFADAVPQKDWLRVVTPLEALVGFGLLSASISYLLLLYPVLARRRSLAYELSLLSKAERQGGLSPEQLDPAAVDRLYADLTARLVAIERDLVHFPAAYYFAESDERFSLAAVAPYLLDLARRGTGPEVPEPVRLRAVLLRDALDDFANTTADRFHRVRADSTEAILEAYARDHMIGERA
jgi:hypothetical protein